MNKPRWNPSIFHSQGKIVLECTSLQTLTYDQQEAAAEVELRSCAEWVQSQTWVWPVSSPQQTPLPQTTDQGLHEIIQTSLFSRFSTWWVTSSFSRKINKRTTSRCHEFSGYQLWALEVLLSHSSLVMVINPRNNASSSRNITAFYLYFSFVIKYSISSMDIENTMSTLSKSCIYF